MRVAELREKCICKDKPPTELVQAWMRRFGSIVRRWLRHGHRIDSKRMNKTLELVVKLDSGDLEAYRLEHWNRSHHLKECPCHPNHAPRSQVTA